MTRIPNYRRATGEPVRPPAKLRLWLGAVLFFMGTLLALMAIAGSYTSEVLQTLAGNCIFTLCILIPAAMIGWAFTAPLDRAGDFERCGWPIGYRLILSTALGLGFLSLGMLLLGSLGLLQHGIPLVLPIVAAAIGFYPVLQSLRQLDRGWFNQPSSAPPLLLAACIPLALLLIAATFPAGSIWSSEGGGYDVLLYHLELPREYMAANSTAPLQHNVYSFFPSNMEMLYTLLISLTQTGFGIQTHLLALYPAQLLHACLTVLAAGAVALAPVRCSTLARGIAITLMLGTPWTLVVGSLAYNDGAVLLYGALAIGMALAPFSWRTAMMAGIFVGLAVGCKMTSGVMIALPVATLFLLQRRWLGLLAIIGVAILLYMPWAIRAMAATHSAGHLGNPVFPVAANTLGTGQWSPEQVERWNRGHSAQTRIVSPDGAITHEPLTLTGRLHALAHETLGDSQWSPGLARLARWTQQNGPAEAPTSLWANVGLIWLVVPLVLVLAATRGILSWQLLMVLAVQILAWLFCTHLQARFLLPAIIPMALLFGLAAQAFLVPRAIIVGFVALNAALCAFLLIPEARLFAGGPPGLRIGQFFFLPQEFSRIPNAFPQETRATMKTYLIGPPFGTPLYMDGQYEYNSVWDTNAWADQLRQSPQAAIAWLRQNHITLVVIDWNEVGRLRNSYGFDPIITHQTINALIGHGLNPANAKYGIPGVVEIFEVAGR